MKLLIRIAVRPRRYAKRSGPRRNHLKRNNSKGNRDKRNRPKRNRLKTNRPKANHVKRNKSGLKGPDNFTLRGNSLIVVDSFICVSNDSQNSNFERIANPQKRPHCNRATSFNLLPMASGESEGNRILLTVAASLAELLDSLAKSFEEFGVIYHARGLLLLTD